jgi:uncharacterized membrane protein
MFGKILEIAMRLAGALSGGKIKTKDQLTTLIGAIMGIVAIVLNQAFDIELPKDMQLTIVGVIVTLIFLFWKPNENRKPPPVQKN